jgi:hypothetical protein
MSTENLNAFPEDFLQVLRFQFPLIDGREEICALGILPSERLVIVTELPGRPLTHCLPEVFMFACGQYGLLGLGVAKTVCIYSIPSHGFFHLVEISSYGFLVELLRLFRAPGPELTPAHLRQLVGMLPAIREVMAEGQGGVE